MGRDRGFSRLEKAVAMRTACTWSLALIGLILLAGAAAAQPAGLDAGRDCQTIRACQYARGGAYRGCISAYSCRVCRFVRAPCTIDGTRRLCHRLRCTWG
jgi:hypothetical protein